MGGAISTDKDVKKSFVTSSRDYNEQRTRSRELTPTLAGHDFDFLSDNCAETMDYSRVTKEHFHHYNTIDSINYSSSKAGKKLREGRNYVMSSFRIFFTAIRVSSVYVLKDFLRRPRDAIIGFVTVLMLVFFTGSIVVGITKTPYILLRLSELSVSEIDALMVANGESLASFINFTDIKPRLAACPAVLGAVPRWVLQLSVSSPKDAWTETMPKENTKQVENAMDRSNPSKPTSIADVMVIESQAEINMGLGRAWPYAALQGNQVQMYDAVAEYLGVQGNDKDKVQFTYDALPFLLESGSGGGTRRNDKGDRNSFMQLLRGLYGAPPTTPKAGAAEMVDTLAAHDNTNLIDSESLSDMSILSIVSVLKNTFSNSYGKYNLMFSNVAFMEYAYINQWIKSRMSTLSPFLSDTPNAGRTTEHDGLRIDHETFRLSDSAMMVASNFRDRYNMYYASKDTRDRRLIKASDSLMSAAGVALNATVTYPIAVEMKSFEMFKAMMVAMLIEVFFAVVCLGGVLVFTMLSINADERQYEMAMLRAQGMPKIFIGNILFIEMLGFTVPGVCVGMCLIYFTNGLFEYVLSRYTHAPPHVFNVPLLPLIVPMLLGLVIPAMAVYGPIQRALSSNLRDALDVYRMVTNEVYVVMIKFNRVGLDLWIVAVGILLAFMGFMVYYLVPYSYINLNMMLFFCLLDVVLLFMTVGVCLVVVLLEPWGELGVLWGLLWGGDRRLHVLIRKNMNRHRERNAKVFVMIVVTMACVVSEGLMFSQLSQVTSRMSELVTGAQVSMRSTSFSAPLDETKLNAFLTNTSAQGGAKYVANWAYSSFPLSSYTHIIGQTTVSNLVSTKTSINVVSLTQHFSDSSYDTLNMVAEYNRRYKYPLDTHGEKDVVMSMYKYPPIIDSNSKEPDAPTGELFVSGLPSGSVIPDYKTPLYYRAPALIAASAVDLVGVSQDSPGLLYYKFRNDDGEVTDVRCQIEIRALMNRVAGFVGISSIPLSFSAGALLMPRTYFDQILNNNLTNPNNNKDDDDGVWLDEGTDNRSEQFSSESRSSGKYTTYQQVLYIRLRNGLTQKERDIFINQLQTYSSNTYHKITDGEDAKKNLKEVAKLVMVFYYLSSLVCSVMCVIMLWVTFIANVNMDRWSLGVLRSIGFCFGQLLRASIYESVSIVISSFVMGTIIGMGIGFMLASQLSHLLGLPNEFSPAWQITLVLLAVSILSAVLCSVLPMLTIRTKAISLVLRKI